MIPRSITHDIQFDLMNNRKIILLYGPRQVGKTTLVKKVLAGLDLKKLEINADQLKYNEILSSGDSSNKCVRLILTYWLSRERRTENREL